MATIKKGTLVSLLVGRTDLQEFSDRLNDVFPNNGFTPKSYWNTVLTQDVMKRINKSMRYNLMFDVAFDSDVANDLEDLLEQEEYYGVYSPVTEKFPIVGNCKTFLLGCGSCADGCGSSYASFEHIVEYYLTEHGEIIDIHAYVYSHEGDDDDDRVYVFRYEDGLCEEGGEYCPDGYMECNALERILDPKYRGVFYAEGLDYLDSAFVDLQGTRE